jgi:hemerythrin superfamily protein
MAFTHILQEREERKRQKEAETNALKVATERRKIERMMNARLPDSKPTRVFEKRTEWVRSKLDKEREDQQNEETVMKQRQEREKKLGEYLRTLIDVNEEERKNKYPGYTSLSATQRNAAQRAAEGKASYRAAYKANQRRLQEVAETRPTLIERHDRSVGAMQAANAALQKVRKSIYIDCIDDDDDDDDDYGDDCSDVYYLHLQTLRLMTRLGCRVHRRSNPS